MLEKKFGIEIHPTWHDTADSSPEVFVADVRSELARILRSQAGEAIANSLQFHRKTICLCRMKVRLVVLRRTAFLPTTDRP